VLSSNCHPCVGTMPPPALSSFGGGEGDDTFIVM
jgi:hypothetical protein